MKVNLPDELEYEKLRKVNMFMPHTNHKALKHSVTAVLLNITSLDKYICGIVYSLKLVINGILALINKL